MQVQNQTDQLKREQLITLPDIPILCVNGEQCALLTTEGELRLLSKSQIQSEIENKHVLVCHAPYTKSSLEFDSFYPFDILELFAFVHPTRFCVPTPAGLAKSLFMPPPSSLEDAPISLIDCAKTLLKDLRIDSLKEKADPLKIAAIMGLRGKGWGWTPFIFLALGASYDENEIHHAKSSMNIWKHLPEWSDDAPRPPPSHFGVDEKESLDRLATLLNAGDRHQEIRSQQKNYCTEMAHVFAPMRDDENPHVILAQAGTGVGKTLGYLAPASVWSEKNDAPVWISTYTKNLQRQIDSELDRLYPHPQVKDAYVTIRKGRENYLCLLNLEDLSAGLTTTHTPVHAIAAGIMARWCAATKDGDLSGGDFPGWLTGLLGYANTTGLADKRGECLFSACDHYHRCFVEKSVRKSKRARIVIANHALVMINAAIASPNESLPTRYIFDEGHHLFDAADSAFSAHLTARESAELRRWILGNEGSRKGRARGLKRRIEDLIADDSQTLSALEDIIHYANVLCAPQWSKRFKDKTPLGASERFLSEIARVVYARSEDKNTPYSLETPLHPIDDGALNAADKLHTALNDLITPIKKLHQILHKKLEDDKGEMEADARKRIDAICTSLERRALFTLNSWIAMLETLKSAQTTPTFIDWLEIERIDGQSVDVGMHRHYIDPMKPFAATFLPHLHGMGITSATLLDQTNDETVNKKAASERCGANYFTKTPLYSSHASPFDYAKQTQIFIINDINKHDLAQVSSAYRSLFLASGGGALGLFTAIHRLRSVYDAIYAPLSSSGITTYAQHINDMDTGTLIDIFRDDLHACLLGTDAVRDGVDIPGGSLRLLVFDRVPWSRPTILHKTRREAFGKNQYEDMLTRLKLKQAFGRLVRRADDRGIFVMLDSALPSRLHSAFPPDVPIIKTSLSDACRQIRLFWEDSELLTKSIYKA